MLQFISAFVENEYFCALSLAENLENTKLRATKQIKTQLLFQDVLRLLEMLLEGGKRLDRWFAGFRASDADKQ